MKAKELMIGDKVIFRRVSISPFVIEVRTLGYNHINELKEDLFHPIPLTAEILEKNGFERRGCISYHKPHIGLIIHHWNDDLCFLNYSKKNIPPIMIPFHYVHELQHALRLCGLRELADNFKI